MFARILYSTLLGVVVAFGALTSAPVQAAPYAAMVMDARNGEVLHSRNADTRLHPASLTKMMTLYIAFEALRLGEITLDTEVTISANAAAEPPSELGLRAGSTIRFRYLIRAAAIRSANDAATAIGEVLSGSEAAFARRMNRTATALGMTRTTFRNANGLTEEGHLSTARDMTMLGRRLIYDYPQYYNIFSRVTADAGIAQVRNTNRVVLTTYRGADGIKTGYTRAAGFNLVASAQRGEERIIATVFGGQSSAWRNERVMSLLDMGFERAPSSVALRTPPLPTYSGIAEEPADTGGAPPGARAVSRSPRPVLRPGPAGGSRPHRCDQQRGRRSIDRSAYHLRPCGRGGGRGGPRIDAGNPGPARTATRAAGSARARGRTNTRSSTNSGTNHCPDSGSDPPSPGPGARGCHPRIVHRISPLWCLSGSAALSSRRGTVAVTHGVGRVGCLRHRFAACRIDQQWI